MGPTWVLSSPDGPHVGLMNLAIRVASCIHQLKFPFTEWCETPNRYGAQWNVKYTFFKLSLVLNSYHWLHDIYVQSSQRNLAKYCDTWSVDIERETTHGYHRATSDCSFSNIRITCSQTIGNECNWWRRHEFVYFLLLLYAIKLKMTKIAFPYPMCKKN